MKKSLSFVFEYSDESLEIHEDVSQWIDPRKALQVDAVYFLGSPDQFFFKCAYSVLGPNEDYCVIPTSEERFYQLKLEALLDE